MFSIPMLNKEQIIVDFPVTCLFLVPLSYYYTLITPKSIKAYLLRKSKV
jgi:hypothetical protein